MNNNSAGQPPFGVSGGSTKATSRPITICHDLAPRILVDHQLSMRIYLQRCIAKLPLEVLAEAIGLSVADLDEIERGQASLPAALLPQIAFAVGKPVEWFYVPLVRRISDARISDLA